MTALAAPRHDLRLLDAFFLAVVLRVDEHPGEAADRRDGCGEPFQRGTVEREHGGHDQRPGSQYEGPGDPEVGTPSLKAHPAPFQIVAVGNLALEYGKKALRATLDHIVVLAKHPGRRDRPLERHLDAFETPLHRAALCGRIVLRRGVTRQGAPVPPPGHLRFAARQLRFQLIERVPEVLTDGFHVGAERQRVGLFRRQ